MPSRRSAAAALSILAVALLASVPATAAASGEPAPPEFFIEHVNDLFAVVDDNDDRYTATITMGASFRGWELELSENMFTDRQVNGIRFDETYLTVARNFTPGDKGWLLRAEAGVVDVGEGIYGESFQNWVHRVVNQDEYFLQYVEEDTHLFAGLRVSRPVAVSQRFTLTPVAEHENSGFKRHSLVALRANYGIARHFGMMGELGYRWAWTDFAPLDVFVEDGDPALGVGVSYRRWVHLPWTKNHFGTGSNHWHLSLRIPLKKNSSGTAEAD